MPFIAARRPGIRQRHTVGAPTPKSYTQIAGSGPGTIAAGAGYNFYKGFTVGASDLRVRKIDLDFNVPSTSYHVQFGFATAAPASTTTVAWVPGVYTSQPVYLDFFETTSTTQTYVFADEFVLSAGGTYYFVGIVLSGGISFGLYNNTVAVTGLTWGGNITLGNTTPSTSFGATAADTNRPAIRLYQATY